MINYTSTYACCVLDKIVNGKKVYILDKATHDVYDAGVTKAAELLEMINADNKNERFVFWTEEEVKDE